MKPVFTELDAAPPKLMKMIRCGCKSWLACFDAAGLRGTQAEWELGTASHRELMKPRLMIRSKLTLFN